MWQTDRRKDILPHHCPRYAYASRGKNWALLQSFLYLNNMLKPYTHHCELCMRSSTSGPCGAFCYLGHFKKLRIIIIIIIIMVLLTVPRADTSLGLRRFSVAGPCMHARVWNRLPHELHGWVNALHFLSGVYDRSSDCVLGRSLRVLNKFYNR